MNTLNYAQKTNFICGCSLFPDLEFYVQNITLPGITFQLSETKVLNLSHFAASTNHSYGDLGISFLLDEDYKIYDMFFNEMLNSKSLTNGTYLKETLTCGFKYIIIKVIYCLLNIFIIVCFQA